jgi:hypothetical protein
MGLEGSSGSEYITELLLAEGLSTVFMTAFIAKLEETEALTDVFKPVFHALWEEMIRVKPSDAGDSWRRVYNGLMFLVGFKSLVGVMIDLPNFNPKNVVCFVLDY